MARIQEPENEVEIYSNAQLDQYRVVSKKEKTQLESELGQMLELEGFFTADP